MYVKTNMEIGYIVYIGEEKGKDYGGVKEKCISEIKFSDKNIVNVIMYIVEKKDIKCRIGD